MFRNAFLTLSFVLFAASPCWAQQWANDMFDVRSHDFGSVAKGAKAEFRFVFTNIFVEDVHIVSARASCGCTSVRIENPSLTTWQEGAIVATLNTPTYLGNRSATITVTIDRPFPARVSLHVAGNIHGDVVLNPGSVNLGSVDHGAPVAQSVSIQSSGRSGLRIVGIRSPNPHITATLTPASSGWGGTYRLDVQLDEAAPIGYIREHLMLVTSDPRRTNIPVLVEGNVLPAVTVSPSSLMLGVIQPGEKVTQNIVIRGKKPFRITGLSADGDGIVFDLAETEEPKSLHVVPLTFLAGDEPGKIEQTIHIETDLEGEDLELRASAVVTQ